MADSASLLAVCTEAAHAGGQELLAWRNRFARREKSPKDLVTDADLASEKAITEVIKQHFPDHAILGEESAGGSEQKEDLLSQPFCWVVDPLDGTTNYVHDFPYYGVSIAVTRHGALTAGVVLDPVRQEIFQAAAGSGATLNGKKLYTSKVTCNEEALAAVSFPPNLRPDAPDVASFLRVAPACQAVRRIGSAALNLAYVACGRLDAHWAHFIYPWDAAAGILLVQEAGGTATAPDGSPFDLLRASYFAAATDQLHADLLPLVSGKNG